MPTPFVHRHRVRYRECDAQGVVFNANYLAFIDDAFVELYRSAFGEPTGLGALGLDTMVVDAHLAWRSPTRFDDVLDIGMEIVRFGRTSQTTAFTIGVGERVVADGEIVHVYVDASLGKVEVPESVQDALASVIHVRPPDR